MIDSTDKITLAAKRRDLNLALADTYSEELDLLRPSQAKKDEPVVDESNFYLDYKNHEGAKLGQFQIADPQNNEKERYQRATNILKVNNSKIDNRYHGKNYKHSYWLYGSPPRIYRQQLKR